MLYTVKVNRDSDDLRLKEFGTENEPVVIPYHDCYETDKIEVVAIETPMNIDRILDTIRSVVQSEGEWLEGENIKEKSKKMPNGDHVHVWLNRFEDKWHGCWEGVDSGLLWVSEPLKSKSQKDAIEEAVECYISASMR